MVIRNPDWALRLGAFDLSPGLRDGYEVRLTGLRLGRPVPVPTVVESMLQDGAVEQVTQHDNRDPQIVFAIKADDPNTLAIAEEQLFLEIQRDRNELVWKSFDDPSAEDMSAESAFDVLWADLAPGDPDLWDILELHGYRLWVLTLRTLPFARDLEPITVPTLASGVTPASTTTADGTSATNWTGGTTVTASGGTLRQTVGTSPEALPGGGTTYKSSSTWTYTPASPITAAATQKYLAVDVLLPYAGYSAGGGISVNADAVPLRMLAVMARPGGITRYIFQCDDTSVAALTVFMEWQNAFAAGIGGPATVLHQIDSVTFSNQAPSTADTPGREALRTIVVEGSARTPASLAVEHESQGLGKVLVYSHPALELGGYSPDMRRWRVSGSTAESPAATGVSGKTSSVGTAIPEVFQVPASSLPRGGFLLLSYGSGNFTDVQVTVSTRLSGGALVGSRVTRNRAVQTKTGFAILADLTLPVVDVPVTSDALVQIEVLSMSGAAVNYDEMFLCALGDGAALTMVDCGANLSATLGTANSRLWVESSSIERTAPTIWVGTTAKKADAYHGGGDAGSWMNHQFVPPGVTVFVANTGGANPAISATYYRKAHTHLPRRAA